MRLALSLLLAVVAGLLLGGCVADDGAANDSPRPWATPRGWGTGLPSTINEGR